MVSCVILNYNGRVFLERCIKSVQALTYADKEIIFLDNASIDDSVAFVKQCFSHIRVVVSPTNIGYAGGANMAVDISRGEYVLILNPDIIFEPDYLDHLVARLEADCTIGAIIGKLQAYDFEHDTKTGRIDSTGLLMYRNRRCVDRGQGEVDLGQYDTAEEVFGVTGACPLFRKAALEKCKIEGEYFDSSFFMYKEDVDICWRLLLFGWKCFYEPHAVAYHGRGTGAFNRSAFVNIVHHRKDLSLFQKHHSYKNERLMRLKNELPRLIARDFFHILSKEVLMAAWMCLREPYLLKSLYEFAQSVPQGLRKRREIMRKKKVAINEIERWFI